MDLMKDRKQAAGCLSGEGRETLLCCPGSVAQEGLQQGQGSRQAPFICFLECLLFLSSIEINGDEEAMLIIRWTATVPEAEDEYKTQQHLI